MKNDFEIYNAWNSLLNDLKDYASNHSEVIFEKEAYFPDYIYRMHKAYDLPTQIMSASLSDKSGQPVLMASISPRHSTLKKVTLHPYDSHVYRKLKYNSEKKGLVEGSRVFNKEMLFDLADNLFAHTA